MNIILASGSPRRRELLANAQLEFSIISIDIDETPYAKEMPKDYIERMVATKATAAVQQFNDNFNSGHTATGKLPMPFMILTADTIGVLADGQTVLVKPSDRHHAYSMWQNMSDNTHQVWTAVQATLVTLTTIDNDSSDYHQPFKVLWQKKITERTEVTFVPLTPTMMSDYWDSGEPADKAGGYAIQGLAAAWVTCINGSYTNVVGLPLAQTLVLIDEAKAMSKRYLK